MNHKAPSSFGFVIIAAGALALTACPATTYKRHHAPPAKQDLLAKLAHRRGVVSSFQAESLMNYWLNGERVLSFDYTDPKWAREIELLRIRGADLSARGGKLWLQDHGADVWFRNLRMREIPKDEVIVADPDFTPMEVPPAALEKENERVRKMLEAAQAKPKR